MKTIWLNHVCSQINEIINKIKTINPNINIIYSNDSYTDVCWKQKDIEKYQDKYDENYIEYIISFINEKKIDLYYPWKQVELIIKNYDYIIKNINHPIKIIIPSIEKNNFDIIENKQKTYEYLQSKDKNNILNIPEQYVVNNKEDFLIIYDLLKLKGENVCIKPLNGSGGRGFRKICENISKEQQYEWSLNDSKNKKNLIFEKFIKIMPTSFDDIIIMKYLESNEISVDIFCINGKIKEKVIREKNLKNDEQIIIESKIINQYIEFIAESFKLQSFNNIQFITHKDKFYLLEVNPRPSGGIIKSEELSNKEMIKLLFEHIESIQ